MCGFVKEGECWRVRINKEVKQILQGDDIVKIIKSLMLKECKTERCQNQLQRLK